MPDLSRLLGINRLGETFPLHFFFSQSLLLRSVPSGLRRPRQRRVTRGGQGVATRGDRAREGFAEPIAWRGDGEFGELESAPVGWLIP